MEGDNAEKRKGESEELVDKCVIGEEDPFVLPPSKGKNNCIVALSHVQNDEFKKAQQTDDSLR